MTTKFTYTKGSNADLAALRASVPEIEVVDKRLRAGAWGLDVVFVWMMLFGIWPLANPEHDWASTLSVIDNVAHWSAAFALGLRWKVVRS